MVDQSQLVAVHGVAQVDFDVEPVDRAVAQDVVEHVEPAAAACLGPVHGLVGVLEELGGWVGGRGGDGDPDAGGNGNFAAVDHERRAQRSGDPVGDPHRFLVVAELLTDKDELVPAEAGRGVGAAQLRGEPATHLHEQVVSGGVPQAVVDELEVVQVQEQHRHMGLMALGSLEGEGETVQQQVPVGQAGEGSCRVRWWSSCTCPASWSSVLRRSCAAIPAAQASIIHSSTATTVRTRPTPVAR